MEQMTTYSPAVRFLLTWAAIVVVVAGMRAASPILVPFLLSLFVSIICAPPLFWLQRKGVPTVLALIIVIIGILGVGASVVAVVGTSVNDFSRALPFYERRLQEVTAALILWIESLGVDVPRNILLEYFNPGAAMKLVGNILTQLSGLLTNAFLIMLTVIFILLEAWSFPARLRSVLTSDAYSLGDLNQFVWNMKRYVAIKTIVSLFTGGLVALWLIVIGVDYPFLWGLFAFFLNYVPNLGSIIAAVPAVLLGLIQLGVGHAALAAAGYLVVNVGMGNIVEPKLMGRGLGLSTLVVFLSLVFWGWVLGPVGMLLSVPLTVTLKIALESNEQTRGLAILLGSRAPFDEVHVNGADVSSAELSHPDSMVDSERDGAR
jgi:predicted PurR-regulated permease PerM